MQHSQLLNLQLLLPFLPALHHSIRSDFDSIRYCFPSATDTSGCRERHTGQWREGIPFQKVKQVWCWVSKCSELSHRQISQASEVTSCLLFPTLIRTCFSLDMQLRQALSYSLFMLMSQSWLICFGLYFFFNNGSKLSHFGDSPGHHSQGTPTHGTRHRLLNPGARLALKHLNVAINKQLRKKINKLLST